MLRLFLPWAGFPFFVAATVFTVDSFNLGLLGPVALLLGLATLAGWLVWLLVATGNALFSKDWKRAATLPAALVCAVPLTVLGVRSGDYIHLALLYPRYAAQIYQDPDWRTKEFRFGWGDRAIFVGMGVQMEVLVYDASGKTVVGKRPDSEGLHESVSHLIGNFYLLHVYSS